MNEVSMRPGVVRGEEVVRSPTDDIHVLGVGMGNVQVAEYRSCDREGSPRHSHEWDEVEIVIEGEVEFTIGETSTLAGPGSVQYLPAGTPHAVRVPVGEARVVMVTIGPAYDAFAREVARRFASGASLPEIAAAAERFGVRLACDTPADRPWRVSRPVGMRGVRRRLTG
jgi:quercetin dioxygenase-like cupin family protein